MTRPDALSCVHEPFGDAFYYGPERMSTRYNHDEAAREKSGYAEVRYDDVMGRILKEMLENDVSVHRTLYLVLSLLTGHHPPPTLFI